MLFQLPRYASLLRGGVSMGAMLVGGSVVWRRVHVSIGTTPDATLEIDSQNATTTTLTVTAPAEYAGAYTVQHSDLAGGPVWLVDPTVSGSSTAGAALTAVPGLSVHDADAGTMTVAGQWYRGATAIVGATGLTYTIVSADQGNDVTYRQTATDDNGSRTASTDPISVVMPGQFPDTFSAPNGTLIADYVGESGIAYDEMGAAESGGVIQDGFLFSADDNDRRMVRRQDVVGASYSVITSCRSTSNDQLTGWFDRGIYPAVGVKAETTGFSLLNSMNNGVLKILKYANGTLTDAKAGGVSIPLNTDYTVKMDVDGDTCTVSIDGTVIPALTFTDPDLVGGSPGYFYLRGNNPGYNKLASFHVEHGA